MANSNSFLLRQISQIRTGGIRVLSQKVVRLILELVSWPLVILFVLVIRIIKPLVLIRTNSLFSSRIGGIAPWPEIYLCEKDAKIGFPNKRFIDIWYHGEKPCNKQIAKMWERTITIYPRWLMSRVAKAHRLMPGGAQFIMPHTSTYDLDKNGLLRKSAQHIKWTNKELQKGAQELRKLGVPDNCEFVCLIVRDNAYLDWWRPNESWDYFNYRNGNIDNYVLAAEALAERGIYTIRMGAKVEKKIPTTNKFVIDYASDGFRTDFMDIFLGAHCKFAISTPVGLDEVSRLFRRPIIYVDFINWILQLRRGYLSIGKHYFDKNTERQLTWRQILEFEKRPDYSFEVKFYDDNAIYPEFNTPEEIRDVVLEMDDLLNIDWVETDFDRELQNQFWSIFEEYNAPLITYGVNYGKGISSISAKYLRDNHQWFLA